MPSPRTDLSDWLIHFVHRRNPANDPRYIYGSEKDEDVPFPYHTDHEKDSRFEEWHLREQDYPLEPDAFPLAVLLKILDDGHLRASWSFRRDRATIYGPRTAVCFTEMPLHALLSYAALRKDRDNVDVYGVCLPKRETFAAGARPVIYGLTGKHLESGESAWPRLLAPACGISPHEQYRYVAMSLGGTTYVDWSHEREWRWCDSKDECSVPGLPIWLDDELIEFSEALILVTKETEAKVVLDKLKELYDAGYSNYDYAYRKDTLRNTRVIVLEDVLKAVAPDQLASLRIEDIPPARHLEFEAPKPTPELLAQARRAIERAKGAGKEAARAYREEMVQQYGTPSVGPFGFATIMLSDNQSALAEALLQLKEATAIGGYGYTLRHLSHLGGTTGTLDEAEAAANAVIAVLESEFPHASFSVRTRLD